MLQVCGCLELCHRWYTSALVALHRDTASHATRLRHMPSADGSITGVDMPHSLREIATGNVYWCAAVYMYMYMYMDMYAHVSVRTLKFYHVSCIYTCMCMYMYMYMYVECARLLLFMSMVIWSFYFVSGVPSGEVVLQELSHTEQCQLAMFRELCGLLWLLHVRDNASLRLRQVFHSTPLNQVRPTPPLTHAYCNLFHCKVICMSVNLYTCFNEMRRKEEASKVKQTTRLYCRIVPLLVCTYAYLSS